MGGRAPWLHALAPKSVEEETFYIKGSSERRPDGPCGEPDQARPVKRSGESRSFSYSPFRFAVFPCGPGGAGCARRPSAVPVSLFPFPVSRRQPRAVGRTRTARRTNDVAAAPPAAGAILPVLSTFSPPFSRFVRGARPRALDPAAPGRSRRGRRPPFAKAPRVFGKIAGRARDGAESRRPRGLLAGFFLFLFLFLLLFFLSFCFEVDRVGLSPAQGAVRILRPALF